MGIFKKSSLPPYHPAKKPPYPGALSSDGIRAARPSASTSSPTVRPECAR